MIQRLATVDPPTTGREGHFSMGAPDGSCLWCWSEPTLWKLAESLRPSEAPISFLRHALDVCWHDLTVAQMAEEVARVLRADLSYPIILTPDGDVMDGMHRLVRAIMEGRQTILAVMFTVLPEPEWIEPL